MPSGAASASLTWQPACFLASCYLCQSQTYIRSAVGLPCASERVRVFLMNCCGSDRSRRCCVQGGTKPGSTLLHANAVPALWTTGDLQHRDASLLLQMGQSGATRQSAKGGKLLVQSWQPGEPAAAGGHDQTASHACKV